MQGSRTAEGVTHARASALIRGALRPLEVTFGRSSKLASSATAKPQSMEEPEYAAAVYLGKPDMGLADVVCPRRLWAFGSLQYLPALLKQRGLCSFACIRPAA